MWSVDAGSHPASSRWRNSAGRHRRIPVVAVVEELERKSAAAGFVSHPHSSKPRELIFAGILVAVAALAPLMPWTMRNLHTLHRFQPLAPRYANDSDEFVMPGFNRWVKTWIADYVSVQEIYWPVPGSDIDFSRLPNRAFDSAEQREGNHSGFFREYNEDHDMSSGTGRRLCRARRPASSGSTLAVLRLASGTAHCGHVAASAHRIISLRSALVGVQRRSSLAGRQPGLWRNQSCSYVVMSVAGCSQPCNLWHRPICFLSAAALRYSSGSLENPEPRYTLECYPAVLLLGSALFHRS